MEKLYQSKQLMYWVTGHSMVTMTQKMRDLTGNQDTDGRDNHNNDRDEDDDDDDDDGDDDGDDDYDGVRVPSNINSDNNDDDGDNIATNFNDDVVLPKRNRSMLLADYIL